MDKIAVTTLTDREVGFRYLTGPRAGEEITADVWLKDSTGSLLVRERASEPMASRLLTQCATCPELIATTNQPHPHCSDCGHRWWQLATTAREEGRPPPCRKCLLAPACTREHPYRDGKYGTLCQPCQDADPEPADRLHLAVRPSYSCGKRPPCGRCASCRVDQAAANMNNAAQRSRQQD